MRAEAEVEKLARALHADPQRLAALEVLAPRDIRGLRHAVTDALLEADQHHFSRVARRPRHCPPRSPRSSPRTRSARCSPPGWRRC